MGNEFKTLIYILIALGYIISRLYRKELAKQTNKKYEPKPRQSKTAEEIFRELQKTLNLPDLTDTQTSKSVSKKPIKQSIDTRSLPQEGKRMVHVKLAHQRVKLLREKPAPRIKSKKYEIISSLEQVPDMDAHRYRPDIDFDPRKAILFSEIMKRPQY